MMSSARRSLRFGSDKVIGGRNVQHQRIGDVVRLIEHLSIITP
jgi:hypothetical protein